MDRFPQPQSRVELQTLPTAKTLPTPLKVVSGASHIKRQPVLKFTCVYIVVKTRSAAPQQHQHAGSQGLAQRLTSIACVHAESPAQR
jgi:hypothetical protein